MYGDFPAKNTYVHRIHMWFWPTLQVCKHVCKPPKRVINRFLSRPKCYGTKSTKVAFFVGVFFTACIAFPCSCQGPKESAFLQNSRDC